MRWIIDKVHKNVKKKTKSESLAALEEALHEAKRLGNKKAADALERTIRRIKKNPLSK